MSKHSQYEELNARPSDDGEETVERVTSYISLKSHSNENKRKEGETESQYTLRIAKEKADFLAKYNRTSASSSSTQFSSQNSFDFLENNHLRLSLPSMSSIIFDSASETNITENANVSKVRQSNNITSNNNNPP